MLLVVYFSYRQTIAAYPHGGGSYTVAKENLGTTAGLFAAAALMLDYVLVVAVGISAGVGALVSAVPGFSPTRCRSAWRSWRCITAGQPPRRARVGRGVHRADLSVHRLAAGGARRSASSRRSLAGGGPTPVTAASRTCPAVSGGEPLDPDAGLRQRLHGDDRRRGGQQRRRRLPRAGGRARPPHADGDHRAPGRHAGRDRLSCAAPTASARPSRAEPGYQSILSQLVAAVVGTGVFYYVTIGSVLSVLALSANTGFADFPRLCRVIAQDGFLPSGFAHRGRRLVYSQGIIVLAVLSGGLLIVFGGITDHLIPLFAVGAFLAFTLSQAGMVAHWRKARRAARRQVDGDQRAPGRSARR